MEDNQNKDFQENENMEAPDNTAADNNENMAAETTNSDTNSDLETKLNETNDKYLRLVAEFDNFRKRTAKERLELIKSAGEDIISDLLEVIDDSERAAQQIETSDDIDSIRSGIQLVFQKLHKILNARGLSPMNAAQQEFNPDLHEAITEIPAPSEDMKGKVIDEVVKGYTLNDKIIRHAKVVVGK